MNAILDYILPDSDEEVLGDDLDEDLGLGDDGDKKELDRDWEYEEEEVFPFKHENTNAHNDTIDIEFFPDSEVAVPDNTQPSSVVDTDIFQCSGRNIIQYSTTVSGSQTYS